MDDVKKKVLLDLFAAPVVVLPVVGGLTALLVSWAAGGEAALNLAGLAGLLGGAGAFATRLIFGLENLTERAYQYLHDERRKERERELDELDEQLQRDGDPRTERCLRDLRQLYGEFQEDLRTGKIKTAVHDVGDNVERLFHACIEHLRHSLELWEVAQKLRGTTRQETLAERDRTVDEVADTIDHLGRCIKRFHTFRVERNQSDLAGLRAELEETIQVARRTEERMANWDRPKTYSAAEFE